MVKVVRGGERKPWDNASNTSETCFLNILHTVVVNNEHGEYTSYMDVQDALRDTWGE